MELIWIYNMVYLIAFSWRIIKISRKGINKKIHTQHAYALFYLLIQNNIIFLRIVTFLASLLSRSVNFSTQGVKNDVSRFHVIFEFSSFPYASPDSGLLPGFVLRITWLLPVLPIPPHMGTKKAPV